MTGRPIAVEFLGLPGSGKSTLAHEVARVLRARGLSVEEPTYALDHESDRPARVIGKLLRITREIVAHPGYALRSWRALRATRQDSTVLGLRMGSMELLISALVRRRRRAGAVRLLDQGIFQALWSVALGGEEGAIRRLDPELLRRMPRPDVVAVIEADLSTIARRLSARGWRLSRADRWEAAETHRFVRAAALLEEVRGLLADCARPPGGVRVLVVPNDADGGHEALSARLAGDLAAMLGGTPG